MKLLALFSLFPLAICAQPTLQSLIDAARPGATIHIEPGVYEDNLKLWKDVTLIGQDGVFLQWNPNPIDPFEYGPAITIYSNASVILRKLTVQDSRGSPAAGIWNRGDCRMEDCLVTGNGRADDDVGGILNEGSLTLCRTTVMGNRGSGGQAGIANSGSLTVIDSTISNNRIAFHNNGTGISNGGYLHVLRSAIYGNGQGIRNGGTAMIEHCTFANAGDPDGQYGIDVNNSGRMWLRHVTIAAERGQPCIFLRGCGYFYLSIRNSGSLYASHSILTDVYDVDPAFLEVYGPSPGMLGELISLGHNLISNTNGYVITGARSTDIYGVNPMLAWFQDNGGPTLTRALLPGSPAIDAGDCRKHELDQRGFRRDKHCDIGAYELIKKVKNKKSKKPEK